MSMRIKVKQNRMELSTALRKTIIFTLQGIRGKEYVFARRL